jgi:hypothetical protein
MELMTVKIIALSLLGGISLILGFIPLKLGAFIETSELGGQTNFWWQCHTTYGQH